jgi:FkbM family methyltransferase
MAKIKSYIFDNCNIIFEIGAYDGVDIDEIKELFGNNCEVHAFEPDPECFSKLNVLYKNEKIICNNIALSNHIGTTKFIKCFDPNISDQSQRSLWHKTIQSLRYNSSDHSSMLSQTILEKEIDVDVTTLYQYCTHNKVQPDILLIDTQGSEWEILDGAKNILDNVKAIMTEWSTKELYIGQKKLQDIIDLLTSYNFELVEKINLWQDFHGDAIFVKKI